MNNPYCEKILKELKICQDCIYYDVGISDSEIYECHNEERWRAEGYTDEDFEDDYTGEINIMAVVDYDSKGNIIGCDFYGTCGGKFKKTKEEK